MSPSVYGALPHELWQEVIRQLDPQTDHTTLVRLLSVSRAFWALAATHLYADLRLDLQQLDLLLSPDTQGPSRRTRKALTFVKLLQIRPPPDFEAGEALWAATIPGQVLFPNVVQLCLHKGDDTGTRRENPRRRAENTSVAVWPEVRIFNNPRTCVHDVDGMFAEGHINPQLRATPMASPTVSTVDSDDADLSDDLLFGHCGFA